MNTPLPVNPADLLLNDDLKGEAEAVTAVQPTSALGGTVFSSADFSGNILIITYNPPEATAPLTDGSTRVYSPTCPKSKARDLHDTGARADERRCGEITS